MNNILVLGERPTNDINGSTSAVEKNFSINFSKTKTKYCIAMVIIVICLLTEKNSVSLRQIKMSTFHIDFA